MIARIWHGVTPESKSAEYFDYLTRTGVKAYRSTQGNHGVLVLQRTGGGRAEFLLISLWESFEAIQKFAGPDVEQAVYYPQDDAFLLEREPNVADYQVLLGP